MACCRHAGAYSQELRTRLQDTVENEVAHTGEASSIDSPGQTSLSLSSGPTPSTGRGTAPAAGRPGAGGWQRGGGYSCGKLDDIADDEINDSAQTETEDQSNAKRQRVLASRPDRHGADVNADTCRTIVLAADPEDRGDGLSRLWIGTRNALEPRVDILDICLNHRR